MAIDKTDGSGLGADDRKRHWAYIRIGYSHMKKQRTGRTGWKWVKTPQSKQIFKWIKVGSPLYRQLRAKGNRPVAVRSGKRPNPNFRPKRGTTSTYPNGLPQSKPKPKKGSAGVGGKAGGGAGAKARKAGGGAAGTQAAINQQLGSSETGTRLGPGYADAQAGLQFDAPIHDLKTLIDRLGPQNAQAITDITNWYGNVSQLNAQAGDRAGQIASDVSGQQDQAIQGLMAALGGGANDANAQIAAQDLRDTGLFRTLGGIEQQSRSDLSPIIEGMAAQAKMNQQRENLKQMQDYQLQLADLMGQRGQAKASAQMQVDQYNNELSQQWFQNKLAKLNATLGAEAAGVDLKAKKAALAATKTASGPVTWRSLNPAEKDDLLMRAVGARQTPDGHIVATRTIKQARAWLSGSLKNPVGSGKNPGLLTMLYQYYHH